MSPEELQSFFESTAGQISVIAVIVVLFAGILISGRNQKPDTKAMVTSAILVALAIALNQITLFQMPQGGSVTAFSMLPIVICAYLYGIRRGMMAGMCVGFLNLIFNPFVIHPLQMFLDYPLAFGALALAGLTRNQKYGLFTGYIIGVLGRYFCSVLSGCIFFGQYAEKGFNSLTWSLFYNITYLGVEAVMTLFILCIPSIRKMFEQFKLAGVSGITSKQ